MTYGTMKPKGAVPKLLGRASVVLAVVAGMQCRAQQVTATLSGTVRDASGTVVPQAELTVTNVSTGVAVKLPPTRQGVTFSSPASGHVLSLNGEKRVYDHSDFPNHADLVSKGDLACGATSRTDYAISRG